MHAYVYVEKGEGTGSGNKDFDSHKCFMSLFLKNLFMFFLYEVTKSSSPKWLQKFGILSKEGGNYGKIF